MRHSREVSACRSQVEYILAITFALMVLFIQEGLTYYVSVQTAALVFLSGFLLYARAVVRVTFVAVGVYILFSLMLLSTVARLPDTISQNSHNIMVTTIGVLGYVGIILVMTNLRAARADWVLRFYRRSAAVIIIAIIALIAITDLGVIRGLNGEYFILQNAGLITNYSTAAELEHNLLTWKAMGVRPDIDLFYGERSFLSLVIFVSLVSYVISSRALDRLQGKDIDQGICRGVSGLLLSGGVLSMLYIQSFSSCFYAVILGGFVLSNVLQRPGMIKLTRGKAVALLLLIVALAWVTAETAPYYWYRLTTFSSSVSSQQRFGILFNFMPWDFLLGLHSAERLPVAGFNNGAIYVVMMAGVGGIAVLAYLLERVARMARPLGLAVLSMFAVLAVFSQNGAIFSPNKLVILSFILIPLISQTYVNRLSSIERLNTMTSNS